MSRAILDNNDRASSDSGSSIAVSEHFFNVAEF